MNPLQQLLQQKQILSIRRNHSLEHATLNILARRFASISLAGYSDPGGFTVYGEIPQEELEAAAQEALRRMNDGEANLAIHPYCGTNFVTIGLAAGFASWLGMLGMKNNWKDRLDRLSLVITLSTFAAIIAQPLGPKVQRSITTSPTLGTLKIVKIEKILRAVGTVHRIHTQTE
jgi:hypothetical protein